MTVSPWTHRVCEACWKKRGVTREPIRIPNDSGHCCGCGALTISGIYVCDSPELMRCKGQHNA